MAKKVCDGAYRRLPPAFPNQWMPVVLKAVKFLPKFGGNVYSPDAAVLDSGAEMTLVPRGVPASHNWDASGAEPGKLEGLGGGENTQTFWATIDLAGFTQVVRVWETTNERLTYTMIGQDLLKHLVLVLNGIDRRVLVQQKYPRKR